VAAQFPELPRQSLEQSVHLIDPDGAAYRGAEAAARLLAVRWSLPLRAYRHVPFLARASEVAYGWVATHRAFLSTLTRWLCGYASTVPGYRMTRSLFVRGIALIYLIAFLSLDSQILGLVGSHGILPVERSLRFMAARAEELHLGWHLYHLRPTLCWIDPGDSSLRLQALAGAGLAGLAVLGVAPGPFLLMSWALYLSLATAGGLFLGYQWDNLLLEAGLLAALWAPWRIWSRAALDPPPSQTVLWLLRWLLFRLMFASGLVKILSGDPHWRDLSALGFHYQTQPLPNPVAWYVHQLPGWAHRGAAASLFLIELAVPFLIFMPRRLRMLAVGPFALLQAAIFMTGNYTFFNLLTLVLCVPLLDDRALELLPVRGLRRRLQQLPPRRRESVPEGRVSMVWRGVLGLRRAMLALLAVAVVGVSLMSMPGFFPDRVGWPSLVFQVQDWVAPLRSVNGYGLFAIMTHRRPELVIEGSADGTTWLEYEFPYKPGDVRRPPPWVAPHQPRVDWQLWFAALEGEEGSPWVRALCRRLLEAAPEVLAFVRVNPFPVAPPRFIRVRVYEYRFTTVEERRATGAWWHREDRGVRGSVLSL
jgi:hypothetical protein